jgi:hypothetical protein
MLSETNTKVYVVLELKPICKVGYDLAHQKRKVERKNANCLSVLHWVL